MCLSIPGMILSVDGSGVSRKAIVRYATDDERSVELALVPNAGVGDYVVVHSGFAIKQLREAEAAEALDLLAKSG